MEKSSMQNKRILIDQETYQLVKKLRSVTKLPTSQIIKIALYSLINKNEISFPKETPKWAKNLIEYINLFYALLNRRLNKKDTDYFFKLRNKCINTAVREIKNLDDLRKIDNIINSVYHLLHSLKEDDFIYKRYFEIDRSYVIDFVLGIDQAEKSSFLEFLINPKINNLKHYKDNYKKLEEELNKFRSIDFKDFKIKFSYYFDSYSGFSEFFEFIFMFSRHEIISKYLNQIKEKYNLDQEIKTLSDALEMIKNNNLVKIFPGYPKIEVISTKYNPEEYQERAYNALRKWVENTIKELEEGKTPSITPIKALDEEFKNEFEETIAKSTKFIKVAYEIFSIPIDQGLFSIIESFINKLIKENKIIEGRFSKSLYMTYQDFEALAKELNLDERVYNLVKREEQM